MKYFIPPILLFIVSIGCRKIKTDAVPATNDEDFICMMSYGPEAEFPGGMDAWKQFLQQHIVYPPAAVDVDAEGIVVVQFIVNVDGKISGIEAVSGPDELKETAINAIKNSPDWVPAQLNGRNVKSYKRQPVIFRLENEEEGE